MHATPVTRLSGKILFGNIIILFMFFSTFASASGYYGKLELNYSAYSMDELSMISEDLRSKVKILDRQMRDIDADLNWLRLKISTITDSGRKVPHSLRKSVSLKEKKVAQLRKKKARFKKIINILKVANPKKKVPMRQNSESEPPKGHGGDSGLDMAELVTAIATAGLADWIEIITTERGCIKIRNTLPILFSSGSAVLAKEYQGFLKKLAGLVKPYDIKIYINGYADPDPIHTAKYASNFELGASRAVNVVYEMLKHGLRADVFKIGTTGEHRFSAQKTSIQKSFQRSAQLTVVLNG